MISHSKAIHFVISGHIDAPRAQLPGADSKCVPPSKFLRAARSVKQNCTSVSKSKAV